MNALSNLPSLPHYIYTYIMYIYVYIRHGAKYNEMYLSTSTFRVTEAQVQVHTLSIYMQVLSDVLEYKHKYVC